VIVDATDPAHMTDVGEIPVPLNAEGQPLGVTSRELRVWPQKKLLIEMTFRCSSVIHDCEPPKPPPAPAADVQYPFDLKFFDLSDPVHPKLISSYVPTSAAGVKIKPHEMYLWVDPKNADRGLLWLSFPTSSVSPTRPNLEIVDISNVPGGAPPTEIAEGNWNQFFPDAADAAAYDFDLALHSMAPTADGKITYLAYLRGGFLVLDTRNVAAGQLPAGKVASLNNDLFGPVNDRATWGNGNHCRFGTQIGCSESHSAVPIPGTPYALTTDEVYGKFTDASFGWPWGWMRVMGVASLGAPYIAAQYQIFQNTVDFVNQGIDKATQDFTSYSSHNPTVLPDLAFIAWHSGGLQAIDLSVPVQPQQAGWYSPTPLPSVALEDPALSRGPNKVVMWSYPIIKDGLVYVVDIRNGLYVLRYTGPHADEVAGIHFLEGNSNLGDAVRLAGRYTLGMPCTIIDPCGG
jgi:hypothetical protein